MVIVGEADRHQQDRRGVAGCSLRCAPTLAAGTASEGATGSSPRTPDLVWAGAAEGLNSRRTRTILADPDRVNLRAIERKFRYSRGAAVLSRTINSVAMSRREDGGFCSWRSAS